MKILITGAAGFIGSNLSARLAKSGNEIMGVDNFSPYYSPELKALRVAKFLEPSAIPLAKMDLSDLEGFKKIVGEFNPTTVIHLAAQPGVRTPLGKSYQYIQNNLVAFSNVLQTIVEEGIPEFLYASSSSVYGNSAEIPYQEVDTSARPISIYGATKLANEILTPAFVSESNTRARGMRFFTVYGPWGRPDMAYFRIIAAVLNGSDFTKFGGGEIKRDFTFVDDITLMIEKLSIELSEHPAGFSDVVNIGGGSPNSLNDLITTISAQLGSNPSIVELEANRNDTRITWADVSRLHDLVNSVPLTDLKDGIQETISWAQQRGVKSFLESWVNSTY